MLRLYQKLFKLVSQINYLISIVEIDRNSNYLPAPLTINFFPMVGDAAIVSLRGWSWSNGAEVGCWDVV